MTVSEIVACLPEALLPWYEANKRKLPWREDKDPYHIWVSEIMLQQTRVEAVKPYYLRFMQELPTVRDLASAEDERLHKLWEGLGYYSRVRNMKKTAVAVMESFGGEFPKDYKSVLSLPGIGPYTAGAVCSIAFDLPTPAVDGNVLRVMSRLLNDETPINDSKVRIKAETALAKVYPQEAGAFTQALMELGATVCGPNRKPDCGSCPCRRFCRGRELGTACDLPKKAPKQQRRVEKLTVLILSSQGSYALLKRPDTGLLAGLWEFPNIPGELTVAEVVARVESQGGKIRDFKRQVERNHVFTHIKWNMSGVYVEVAEQFGPYTWLTGEEIDTEAALPTAFRQFWDEEWRVKDF